MNMDVDKWPFVLNLTAIEAGCIIEALATKATEDRRKAQDLEYENNSLLNRTTELESRVGKIEMSLSEGR
jgi:hypothetical protein